MAFNDREIFENISTIYTEICKYYLSESYGVDIPLDNDFFNLFKKESNIEYMNSMYSDNYKLFDGYKIINKNGKNYADLSISDAIERFGNNSGWWPDIVKFVGRWYEENIHTYQGGPPTNLSNCTHDFNLDFIKKVRDDCSGYATACLLVYILVNDFVSKINSDRDKDLKTTLENTVKWAPASLIWDTIRNQSKDNSNFKKLMEFVGFEEIKYDFSSIQPFDIIAGNNGEFHHVEIYAGNKSGKYFSWSWGSVHDKSHGGMPARFVKPNNNDSAYNTIWRIKGLENITDTSILELP